VARSWPPLCRNQQPSEDESHRISAAFWRFAKGHFRKNGRDTGTADNYKPALTLLRQRYGHTPAIEFGPLALKALQRTMLEDDQARRYINDNVHRIRRVSRWAASEQLIQASVPQALAMVEALRKGHTTAQEGTPVEPVEDSVVESTLSHLPKVVADMISLQRLCGARPGEVCALRPADIDRTGEIWRYVPAEHKTEHHGKQRTIYIGPKAQEILLPYLLREAETLVEAVVRVR